MGQIKQAREIAKAKGKGIAYLDWEATDRALRASPGEVSYVDICGKRTKIREDDKFKGPEVGASMMGLRSSNEARWLEQKEGGRGWLGQ